jgi:hypothetical protein
VAPIVISDIIGPLRPRSEQYLGFRVYSPTTLFVHMMECMEG